MNDLIQEASLILKLVSGDTLICQVIKDSDDNIFIRDPYLINLHQQNEEDGVHVVAYYSEWFMSTDSRIHVIRKQHVISAAIPDSRTKEDYQLIVQRKELAILNATKNNNNGKTTQSSSPFEDLNYKFNNHSSNKKYPHDRSNN